MRGREEHFSVDKNRFAVLKMDQETSYTDFNNPEGIPKHLEAVTHAVKMLLAAE